MKPCVITTGASAARRCCSAASGAKSQVAESMLALAEAPRRSSAFSIVRASAHVTSMPCAARNARAELGGHQLAGGHHARARAIADLADERDAGGDLLQLGEMTLRAPRSTRDAQLRGRARWRLSISASTASCCC